MSAILGNKVIRYFAGFDFWHRTLIYNYITIFFVAHLRDPSGRSVHLQGIDETQKRRFSLTNHNIIYEPWLEGLFRQDGRMRSAQHYWCACSCFDKLADFYDLLYARPCYAAYPETDDIWSDSFLQGLKEIFFIPLIYNLHIDIVLQ